MKKFIKIENNREDTQISKKSRKEREEVQERQEKLEKQEKPKRILLNENKEFEKDMYS